MLASIGELLWALRREGFVITPPQAIDAARVCELVGFGDKALLCDALAAVLVERRTAREPFARAFDAFFREDAPHASDLWGRLRARGFTDGELAALRELLDAAAQRSGSAPELALARAIGGSEDALEQLLLSAGVARTLAPLATPLQVGFFTQRLLETLGAPRAANAVSRVGRALVEALGAQRGGALRVALEEELERFRRRVRRHVEIALSRRTAMPDIAGVEGRPFAELSAGEAERVRRALRTLAERLRGAERVRRKRARRGRIDVHRTIRLSQRTGGVAFSPVRRRKRRDRPKLVLLCDVSDSVREVSRYFLELVHAAQELFSATRSFVFVSEIAETTRLFRDLGPERALARIQSGAVVSAADASDYGRVLARFDDTTRRDIDRRTTIVVLGDGRTNYHTDGAELVRRLRERARAVYWICPEGRDRWGLGDSAMPRYADASTDVLVARSAGELEDAARRLVALR